MYCIRWELTVISEIFFSSTRFLHFLDVKMISKTILEKASSSNFGRFSIKLVLVFNDQKMVLLRGQFFLIVRTGYKKSIRLDRFNKCKPALMKTISLKSLNKKLFFEENFVY
jgi:hypothetical protein